MSKKALLAHLGTVFGLSFTGRRRELAGWAPNGGCAIPGEADDNLLTKTTPLMLVCSRSGEIVNRSMGTGRHTLKRGGATIPEARQGRWTRFIIVIRRILLLAMMGWITPEYSRADLILNGCDNTSILEGFFGVIDCTVTNKGDLDAHVTGQSVIAIPIGPDFSDLVIGIIGIGDGFPLIAAGQSHTFQYALFTPPEFDHGDFGISIISPIYSAEDVNGFVKGSYTGGLAAVLDDPMDIPPPSAFPQPPPYTIPSLENFNNFDQYFRSLAGERGSGYTNGAPEPTSLALLAGGLAALS